jgi:putative ABC transport system permease protein
VFLPLPGWGTPKPIWIPGQEPTDRAQAFTTPLNHVGPDYFRTLGLPILEGRPFTDRDDRSAKTVAIVNQTLARHFWPDGRASGRAIVIDGTTADVVGVVRDAEYRDISQAPMPFLYLSYAQQDVENRFNGDSRTHIRVSGDPAAMLPLLRRTIAAVDRNVPISEDLLLSDRVDYHFRHVRAVSTMLVTLGAIGALLSAVALYAVLSLVVRQRTREIAIRMALGARQATVSRMVVRQGFALCAAGAGLGLIAAVPATQLLRSVLFGVTPGDRSTWLVVACLLVLVGSLACYLPARHAARVEPTEALKEG